MDRNTPRRGITRTIVSISAVMLLAFSLSAYFTPASADATAAAPLCGNGSAPNYGFSYDLQQAHWTVDWQDYASDKAVNEVDTVLDRLNRDSIAQTMILIMPQDQVGNRVNCAVHFLRYMKLGLPTGERKDNGFVFLIVIEPTRIDVHYGVGLGLPALTASELTDLNRAAEDAYQATHSMDQALLTLAQGFDTVARSKYAPLISATAAPAANTKPALPTGLTGILSLFGQVCLGIFFLLLVLFLRRRGIRFGSSGMGSRGIGFPMGGSGPSSRGGSGSGRSGRGN